MEFERCSTISLVHHPQRFVTLSLTAFTILKHATILSPASQALCDKDPSVMAASLCGLHDLIAADPSPYRNLAPSFVSILKQVVEGRLPSTYNYHKTPAPFIQVRLGWKMQSCVPVAVHGNSVVEVGFCRCHIAGVREAIAQHPQPPRDASALHPDVAGQAV